jgi:hypothetical protein
LTVDWTNTEIEILDLAYAFYKTVLSGTQIPRGAIRTILRGYHGQIAACWRPTKISPRAAAQMTGGDFSAKSLKGLTRDHFKTVANTLDTLLARPVTFETFAQTWWDSGEVAIVAKGEGTRINGTRTYDLGACIPLAWSREWTLPGSMTVPASVAAREAYRAAVASTKDVTCTST